jgi:hypothetical protein
LARRQRGKRLFQPAVSREDALRYLLISVAVGAVTTALTYRPALRSSPDLGGGDAPLGFDEYLSLEFPESATDHRATWPIREGGPEQAENVPDEPPVKRKRTADAKLLKAENVSGAFGAVALEAFGKQFLMGKTPITNREYSRFRTGFRYSRTENDLPVTEIARSEAAAFCAWWGKQMGPEKSGEGENKAGQRGRLPTAAEWRAAAEGGNPEAMFGTRTGNLTRTLANYGAPVCCGPDDSDGYEFRSPVTAFPPNPFGLFDMAGNVFEWTATDEGGLAVIVGGSFRSQEYDLLIGTEWQRDPANGYADVGFRCVLGR